MDENNKSLKILGRELTPMETRIYLALLKLGKARWEDVQKEIGGGSGGHLRRLLVKMTREGLLSREKRYHQGERGGPYYVYQAVIPQEISGSISNHDKEVREDPNTKGNAESQTNAIRGKIVKEVVAKRWIQEKQGKIYEYGGIAVLLPREYANKKLLIVLPESKNLNRD
jgi:predicted transcriptional regulator